MDFFSRAAGLFADNAGQAILLIAAVTTILFIMNLITFARVRKLSKRRFGDLAEEAADNLARAISSCESDIKSLNARLDAISAKLDQVSEIQPLCVRKVGFVRFDAFDDVGGEQSFSLAMLDGNDNGIILSSIYSRSDSRFYAKRVTGGTASHNLSNEESDALRQASKLA